MRAKALLLALLTIPTAAAENPLARVFGNIIDIITLRFLDLSSQAKLVGITKFGMFIILFAVLFQALQRLHKEKGIFGKKEGGLFTPKQAGIIAFVLSVLSVYFMPEQWIIRLFALWGTLIIVLLLVGPFAFGVQYIYKVEQPFVKIFLQLIALWGVIIIGDFLMTGMDSIPGIDPGTVQRWNAALITTISIAEFFLVGWVVVTIFSMIPATASSVKGWESKMKGAFGGKAPSAPSPPPTPTPTPATTAPSAPSAPAPPTAQPLQKFQSNVQTLKSLRSKLKV